METSAAQEAARLEQGLVYYEHIHRLTAHRWRRLNLVVAALVAVLAAVSASLQAVDGAETIGILTAVLAGAFGALLGVLSPRDVAQAHYQAAIESNQLRLEVRQLRLLKFPGMEDAQAADELKEFTFRRSASLKTQPPVNQRIFKTARRDIEERGMYDYEVDKPSPNGPLHVTQ